jgi:hypothetical protein
VVSVEAFEHLQKVRRSRNATVRNRVVGEVSEEQSGGRRPNQVEPEKGGQGCVRMTGLIVVTEDGPDAYKSPGTACGREVLT